jgi:hypothetical protein
MSSAHHILLHASENKTNISSSFVSFLIWPAIIILPLCLTFNDTYQKIFPLTLYNEEPKDFWYSTQKEWPSPLGLSLGILTVIIGQAFTLLYFVLWKKGLFGTLTPIQKVGAPKYELIKEMISHLSQPEGFVMLGGYLSLTWMFGLMPKSYYSFTGGINWLHVILQLLIQDFVQYLMHILEHKLDARIYKISHKPHHRFTNPKLFDAFNGSSTDTFLMILIPLMTTARLVNANVWSYMVFGSLYANWLTLIHAEYIHSWDFYFRKIGFGTSSDHHVHHKLFNFNYGHLFM